MGSTSFIGVFCLDHLFFSELAILGIFKILFCEGLDFLWVLKKEKSVRYLILGS